jgi:ABC-type Fe3+-hydroxamate transport system substrate-binding protein
MLPMGRKYMPETRRQRFVRLANKRVNRAIKTFRLIGNLSNRTHYEYTDEDVKKIIKMLDDELRAAKQRFENLPKTRNVEFTID